MQMSGDMFGDSKKLDCSRHILLFCDMFALSIAEKYLND